MTTLEASYLDEYKRLNAICADMYQDQNGVTKYINQMDAIPVSSRQRIPFWDKDRSILVRLRHVRNEIVHETDCSSCKETDMKMLLSFYSRLLQGDDALSTYYRQLSEKQVSSRTSKQISKKKRSERKNIAIAVFLAALMVLFGSLIAIWFYLVKGAGIG